MRILVVEDEKRMGELLRRGLSEEGHQVTLASDGAVGLEIARSSSFDVIVLDMMLPSLDGISIARRLRAARNQTPILMLTAKDAVSDTVRGLDAGADDYLTKPFSFEVLLARLRAVSRRGVIPQPVCLEVADLKLDPATREVTREGRRLNLTPREYNLLELLMRHHRRVVSRETILESVWGYDSDVNENTLEAFVRLLRLKVDTREPKLIHTVRGVGYMVREPAA
ncbi:MAG TPA: response regulator transcription factor [Bryobacteraceae bacterium]|nr:response regulator transcription factor [Bryobacteraceae bacterium]